MDQQSALTPLAPDPPGRPPAHNAALAAIAEIAGKLSTLAWTVVAARLLTQEQFGTFNLMLAVALIASALAEGGFDPLLIQKASRDRRRLASYHTQAIAWEVGLALPIFALAGAAVFAARPDADARIVLGLLLGAILLDLWSDTARASAAAAQDQASVAGALVLQRLAAAALMIPALIAGLGLTGMAAAFLASSAVGWVAHVVALRRLGVAFRWRLVDRAGLREFARGSWALALSSIVLIALFRVDSLILAALQGDEAVGQYAAAYRVFETVLFLTYAVTGSVAPVMSARGDDGEHVRRLGELSLFVLSFVYAPFVAVCLVEAHAVLELLYGARYADAAGALQWLAPAPLVYGAAALGGTALMAVGRTTGVFVAAAAALSVNVVLNLLLVPTYAGTGAAVATTAAYAVEAAISLIALVRVKPRRPVAAPAAGARAGGAALAGVLLVLPLPLLVEVPLVVAAYGAAWLAVVRRRRPERLEAVRVLLLRRD